MNNGPQVSGGHNLSPQRLKEKADILETNLFKNASKQTDPAKLTFTISRKTFPDAVSQKALIQLMPRFNVRPRDFLLGIRDLMNLELKPDEQRKFEVTLTEEEEVRYDDENVIARVLKLIVSPDHLKVVLKGIPAIESRHGEIAKSYFNHEKSPGKLHKDGVINFKEINNYPIVTEDSLLFFVSYEKQGKPGLDYLGKEIPVEQALPYAINIGASVQRIEDNKSKGAPRGYYLKALRTGVVLLERNNQGDVISIDISEQVNVKKLDYSTGNIGTVHTCPIQMNVGVVCNGFKIRVHGKVEANIVDGGEIITNNEAVIFKTQDKSKITALKEITIDSASQTHAESERGPITIKTELIDSFLSSPQIIFDRAKGLITNNTIETENLNFNGLYFSGENVIYFGKRLFEQQTELHKKIGSARAEINEIENEEKLLTGQLQMELKRLTHLATTFPDLVQHLKPLLIATKTMDFEKINQEMELIQKRNNTKVVVKVKKIFENLESLPEAMKEKKYKHSTLSQSLNQVDSKMSSMELNIEGYLRKAATIKIFCGATDKETAPKPDFMIESEGDQNRYIKVTGSYTPGKGFEFVQ